MSSEHSRGSLYRLDLDGRITPVLDSIGCSNGMGFSPSLKTFYHTDSFPREIYRFDYNIKTGFLANRRIFATVPESDGFRMGGCRPGRPRLVSALGRFRAGSL